MRNLWLRFGCFLTGYNFSILSRCSEVAKKTVKRYTAALIVMCVLWGLIGYSFASRYLHAPLPASIFSGMIFVLIIVQIERQIIMQTHKNNYLQFFRGWIAVMMALIGSLIIDQIIFKDDIDLEKEQFINAKVEQIYPKRASERKLQIAELNNQLLAKDSQRTKVSNDVTSNPVTTITTVQMSPVPVTHSVTDSTGTKTNTTYVNKPTVTKSQVPNPNAALLAALDSQINTLQRLKIAKEDSLANLRNTVERTLKEKTGFLDELNIMWSLLSKSLPATVVYIIWFLLLLGLELFILMNKRHEKPNDYDHMINHQMDTHIRKLEILSSQKSTPVNLS
jgi:hypothetical protein